MKTVKLNRHNIFDFIDEKEYLALNSRMVGIDNEKIDSTKNDWTGWNELPADYPDKDAIGRIKEIATEIRTGNNWLVVIGIGGSYLGAKAVIEALTPSFTRSNVIFAGFDLDPEYLKNLLNFLKDKDFYVNVISKSGTTIEPAVSFRMLKQLIEKKYSPEESGKRIIITTDKEKGLLKPLEKAKGYRSFVIPDNIGGRFSVLTPVGLLPVAAAGFDIDKLLEGAASACESAENEDIAQNPVYQYAAIRDLLYRKGKSIEIMSSFKPALRYFTEWWKQLFGESEGKEGKGLFPASCIFTTDLHSLGQWIQEGPREIFESFVFVKSEGVLQFPDDPENIDELNYLTGKDINEINKNAYEGTLKAHLDGGVPAVTFELSELSEFSLGELIFFFEKTTALNGYLLEVNPFNQPGVEAYKKNMFHLLGRPGY